MRSNSNKNSLFIFHNMSLNMFSAITYNEQIRFMPSINVFLDLLDVGSCGDEGEGMLFLSKLYCRILYALVHFGSVEIFSVTIFLILLWHSVLEMT